MEFFRWILVLTGVVLLVIAYFLGRKKGDSSAHYRAVPEAYDPSVDELSVPINDPIMDWQRDDEVIPARTARPQHFQGHVADASTDVRGENAPEGYADRRYDHHDQARHNDSRYDHTQRDESRYDNGRGDVDYREASYSDTGYSVDSATHAGGAPADDDYRAEPVQAELGISEQFNDPDFNEVGTDGDDDNNRPTSFASAVKQASQSDDANFVDGYSNADGYSEVNDGQPVESKRFSDEFETYREPIDDTQEPAGDIEEKLVTIHVAAKNNRIFRGSDIKNLFNLHGYKFGQMSLYHCTLDGDRVFSVANMVKPGTFDDQAMHSFETPGITLFMRLPIKLDSDVAFDFLIREASELAHELDGQLRDDNRNPLSDQTIQHMREDIQQYVFRTRRVMQG